MLIQAHAFPGSRQLARHCGPHGRTVAPARPRTSVRAVHRPKRVVVRRLLLRPERVRDRPRLCGPAQQRRAARRLHDPPVRSPVAAACGDNRGGRRPDRWLQARPGPALSFRDPGVRRYDVDLDSGRRQPADAARVRLARRRSDQQSELEHRRRILCLPGVRRRVPGRAHAPARRQPGDRLRGPDGPRRHGRRHARGAAPLCDRPRPLRLLHRGGGAAVVAPAQRQPAAAHAGL